MFYDKELDRGDGVCKHLTADNRCDMYTSRPVFCNVDAYYEKFLTDKMSRDDYYKLNYEACQRLKELTAQTNRDIFNA